MKVGRPKVRRKGESMLLQWLYDEGLTRGEVAMVLGICEDTFNKYLLDPLGNFKLYHIVRLDRLLPNHATSQIIKECLGNSFTPVWNDKVLDSIEEFTTDD